MNLTRAGEYDQAGLATPYHDQPETFEVHRSWRKIADSYAEPRVLIGEIWKTDLRTRTRCRSRARFLLPSAMRCSSP